MPIKEIAFYFIIMSIFAMILTIKDKHASRHSLTRVSEKTLIFVAGFGGAIVMYLTMIAIRHKTRHKKFMKGLPLMILAQCLLVLALHLFAF